MTLSFWEYKNWFSNVDFTIVVSGIVGLHCGLRLRERFPNSKILVLEKGILPEGASTKNAGFACFGSVSEILADLETHTETEVLQLIEKRWVGLQLLRKKWGDRTIDLQCHGGYELFLEKDSDNLERCLQNIPMINALLKPLFTSDVFTTTTQHFGFRGNQEQLIFNRWEAQIDTGNLMQVLMKEAVQQNILILNQQTVLGFENTSNSVSVRLANFEFSTQKLFFATNGFADTLTKGEVKPARAQVLITKPLPNLALKGTFHMDEGYYYFRNFENRILLGGGRNLDFEGETTTALDQTERIQNHLEHLLKAVILPNQPVEIAHRWSGIMGVGPQKKPIVRALEKNVYCGVRLGGMGVAIGSLVGKELADLV